MAQNSDDRENLEAEWLAEAEATANLEGELPTAPNLTEGAIPIPLATEVHQVARGCAEQQRTPEKAEQVRRNLLAVLSVWNYLRIQGYGLELEASDCWNPILRQMNDVADLMVSGIGRLECRVFEADQELCLLPDEVQVDRVGYVGVQLDAEEQWAWLLGFAPALSLTEPVEGIRRAELYSMDEFGAHLHRLRLLHEILARKTDSRLDPELRSEAVALIERMYLKAPEDWTLTRQIAREVVQLMDLPEVGESEVVASSGTFLGTAGQAIQVIDELSVFFDEVFDELNDALEQEG